MVLHALDGEDHNSRVGVHVSEPLRGVHLEPPGASVGYREGAAKGTCSREDRWVSVQAGDGQLN